MTKLNMHINTHATNIFKVQKHKQLNTKEKKQTTIPKITELKSIKHWDETIFHQIFWITLRIRRLSKNIRMHIAHLIGTLGVNVSHSTYEDYVKP